MQAATERDGHGGTVPLMPRPGTRVVQAEGLERGWLMPVVLWDAPKGFDTSGRPDNRPYHTIAWRLSGVLVQHVLPNRQTIEEVSPNGFSIHPAGHDLRFLADGPIRFAHGYLTDAFVRAVATELAGERGDRPELLRGDRVMYLDHEVLPMLDVYVRRAFDEAERPTRLEMDSRASLLALHVLRHDSILHDASRHLPRGGLSPWQLRRVCEAMTGDLTAEVTLTTLAQMVGVSYHHFCHAFKASTGMAPHQWLVERRIDRACELLRTTRDSVTDIAAAVGYEDPNQLTRVFRARRGTAPATYRRMSQR
jgi:AraC family transcriptional regulator